MASPPFYQYIFGENTKKIKSITANLYGIEQSFQKRSHPTLPTIKKGVGKNPTPFSVI
jgi:hypothetical protein